MKNKPKIVLVANILTLPFSPDHSGLKQGVEQLGLEYLIVDPHYHHSTGTNIVDTILPFEPDIICHGMTDSLSSHWIKQIGEVMPNVIQVMSMWDYRPKNLNYDGLWESWKENAPYLKLITLSNKGQLDWWKQDFGVEAMYWPHGCIVKDVEYDERYNFDTIFVGDKHYAEPYKKRADLIDEISRKTQVEWINKGGGDSDKERKQIWKDLGKIYYSSKTCLDISHFWDEPGYASGRYFYTSGLGGCAISKRFPECEELFPEGTKIYFDTIEEAVDKIKFYVNNEKERNEVKKKGKEWANKYHNYKLRFKQLFEKIYG